MILTICIPTVVGREEKFNRLYEFLKEQIIHYQLQKEVEIIFLSDNKEISIGIKREKLYNMAKGIFSVQLDDDDWIAFNYCKEVVDKIKEHFAQYGQYPDCVGYVESCNINGKNIGNSIFSREYNDWTEKLDPPIFINGNWCVRVRTPFFKTPILTEYCIKVGVEDSRFGEDHDFARRVLPLLKTQAFIDEVMYMYGYVSEGTHNERYGIK